MFGSVLLFFSCFSNKLYSETFWITTDTPGFINSYGWAVSSSGNQYGKKAGDVYYLAISSSGALYVGVQLNNATKITWVRVLTEYDKLN